MTATLEVSTHALYVRSGPGQGYSIAGSLSQGQQAVADIAALVYGTWVKVLTPFVGYLYAGDSAAKAYVKLLSIVIQPSPIGETFQIKATTDLNVRSVPTTAGNTPLFYVKAGTLLTAESLNNGWYKLSGVQQFVSAQFAVRVSATPVPTPIPDPVPVPTQTGRIWGINIDPKNPTANPSAATLAGAGWVRFVFHVDAGTLSDAFKFYDTVIPPLVAHGIKVVLILLQDTYWGNGPWSNGNWPVFYPGFADVAGKIAQHYKGLVTAYEIWNEMDLSGQPTSIYIPPENYARLILTTTKSIRSADLSAKVISGGMAGNDPIAYMTAVGVACGGSLPFDAIGYHPYGQTPPNTTVFDWQKNTLSPAIQRLHNAFKLPIWITEIGVPRVDVNNQALWPIIGTYMRNTFGLIHDTLHAICPVLIWFAWSDSQDSAGIVHNDQSHKGAIWDAYTANGKADTENPNQADPVVVIPDQPTPVTGKKLAYSYLGLYLWGEDVWQMGAIGELSDLGRPMPLVMVMREGNPKEITPTQIKVRSPQTIVGERWYYEPEGVDWTQPDLYQVGVQHVKTYVARFQIDRRADFHYTINEPMPGIGAPTFWHGAMDEAKRQDIKLFVGNWPETWPALPGDLDEHGQPKYLREFWTLESVHDMVAQVKAEGHCLCWHTYIYPDPRGTWDHGVSMGREDEIIALLPPALRDVKIALNEWGTGWSQWFDGDTLVDHFHTGDIWLHMTKANVIGAAPWVAAIWTDNAHPTVSSDLGYHRDKLLPYWKTVCF